MNVAFIDDIDTALRRLKRAEAGHLVETEAELSEKRQRKKRRLSSSFGELANCLSI